MVTGDIKETALTIGRDIGILSEKSVKSGNHCFTGKEFEDLPEEKQKAILLDALEHNHGLIFARTEPKHKRQLIQLFSSLV